MKNDKNKKKSKTDKDFKDIKIIKDAKVTKEAKDAKDSKVAKDAKDAKDAKVAKDAKDAKVVKDAKDASDAKVATDAKDGLDEKSKKSKKKNKKSKKYNYFDALVSFTEYSCKASELLLSIVSSYDTTKLEEQMKQMHEIEHSADLAKHTMMSNLVREFITPIEREDITAIAQAIDTVTDTIEDVVMNLYMYNIQTIRTEALEFSETIVSCCNALKTAMEDFHNYKKSKNVIENIIRINNLEEVGDEIYTRAIRNLHTTCTDPIEIMAWSRNFDYLEKCCDSCEDVSDVVESIIMKNS